MSTRLTALSRTRSTTAARRSAAGQSLAGGRRRSNAMHGRAQSANTTPALRRALAGTTALTTAAVCGWLLAADPAWATPTGGVVTEGQADITYGDTTVTIHQHTDRVIIEWQSFDVGAGETVHFEQPHELAAALNIIFGGPSSIAGSITSTGQVFLSNPQGITFEQTAQVDVESIIATTLSIAERTDFMAGGFVEFELGSGSPTATVVNYGSISARGLAALVGPGVRNADTGTIVADVAILGAGEGFALDYYGDGLVNFTITDPVTQLPIGRDGNAVEALVVNEGAIISDGGQVILTADAAAGVIDTVINLDGVEAAGSIVNHGGQVVLLGGDGGTVQVAGTIDVSGEGPGDQGGTVHVLGERLVLDLGAEVDASGPGGGGTVLIGGAERGGPLAAGGHIAYAELEPSAGGGTQISIDTTTPFETESYIPTAEITYFAEGASVDASASEAAGDTDEGGSTQPPGEGGTVVVWGTQEVHFHGTINTMGGSGNGFVEVSTLGSGVIDGIATTGEFLLDPQDVCVESNTQTCGGGLVTPAFVNNSTIKAVLDVGGTFTINTSGTDVDGDGVPDGGTLGGTGRVLFANTTITVNNNTGTQGTFRIEAADTIDLGETLFGSDGSTGTNYQFFAGTNAGGTPNPDADIDTGGQTLNSGGGDVLLNAADDVLINDPMITGGGNVTVIANGLSGTSTVSFGEGDGRIQTTDGIGGAGEVDIVADNIVFNTAAEPVINANGTGGIVTFRPRTAGRAINLGTADASSLSLTDADIDRIAASILRFGNASSGNITISAALSPAQATNLSLVTGGAIFDGNELGADVTATGLALQAASSDGLETAITNLAFNVTGGVDVSNTGALTIAAVDGVTASSATNGAVNLTAASPVTIAANVSASGNVTATATESAAVDTDNVTVNTGVVVQSTGGNVTLRAGDDVNVGAGATVSANGILTLTAGFGDTDGDGGLTIASAAVLGGTTINLTAINDILMSVINASSSTVNVISTAGAVSLVDTSGTYSLGALSVTGSSINLGATISSTGAQTYNSPIVLTGDTVLTSTGGGNITFSSTIDGTFGLTVNTAGVTLFDDRIGGTTAIGDITTDAAGGTTFQTITRLRTVGTMTFNDPVTGIGAVVMDSNIGGGNTTFASTIDGGDWIITESSNLTFGGAIGGTIPLVGLQLNSPPSTVAINGGLIRVTNQIRLLGNLTFDSPTDTTTLESTGGGFIRLGQDLNNTVRSAIDGVESLIINTTGATEIFGVVGDNNQRLDALTTNAGGTTELRGGQLTLAGNTLTFNDAVTLGTNTVITDAGAVSFNSTIDGAFGLTVDAGGNVTFGAAVGGTTPLTSLAVGSGGTIAVNGPITTADGNVTFDADVMAIAASINAGTGIVSLRPRTANRAISLGVETAGSLSLTDAEVDQITASLLRIGSATSGSITFGGTISPALTSTLSLITGNAIIDANGTATDVRVANLALQAANGIADSGGVVILDTEVDTVAARNTTSGGIVILEAAAGGNLTIGTVDGVVGIRNEATAGPLLATQIETNNGDLIVNSDIFVNRGTRLLLVAQHVGNGDRLFDNNAAISTSDIQIQIRANNMELEGGTINAGSGRVGLSNELGGQNVAIDLGGTGAAAGVLGLTDAELDTVTTTGVLQIGNAGAGNITVSQAIAPANVSTLALQTGGAVVDANAAGADITVANLAIRTGAGVGAADALETAVTNLAFANTGGAFDLANTGALTITTVDGLTTSSNTGTTTTITTASPLTFAVNTTSVGTAIYTAGETNDPGTFADDIAVNANVTVSATGGDLTLRAGDEVSIGAGATVSASGVLSLTAGFGDLDGTGGLAISTGAILGGTTINLTAINDILLSQFTAPTSTVNVLSTGGAVSLTDTSAAYSFGALSVTGTSINLGATVNTTGAQTYQSPVTLTANTVLTSTGAGEIRFNSTIDGTFNLTVNTAGLTFFNSAIGSTTLIGDLTTDAAGSTTLLRGLTTNGTLTFNDPVTGGSVIIDATQGGGNTTFASTIDGGDWIIREQNVLTLGGAVGGTAPLVGLQVTIDTGTVAINGGLIRVVNQISLPGNTVFDSPTNTTTLVSEGGGVIQLGNSTANTVRSATDGEESVILNTIGITRINAVVGDNNQRLNSLTTNAGGTTELNGGQLTLAGNTATFNDAVILGMNTVITDAGAVSFNNTVDGAFGLTVNAGGNVTFGGAVGGTTRLTFLTVTSDGTVFANAPIATDNGNVTFEADDMTLGAAVNAGTGIVTLRPRTATRPINLGTETAGSLSLTDAEIDQITASILRIGSATSGDITVSSAITPANVSTLALETGGAVLDGTAGEQADLTITNLVIRSGNGVTSLDTAVTNLAFANTGGAFDLSNTGALTITAVDGLTTSSNTGTTTNVASDTLLTFAVNTDGTGNATFTAPTINVNNGVSVGVASGTLAFNAATVNLDGNLTAIAGISGTATTINVISDTGGAEIQDAVDVALATATAGNPVTINVAVGTYASFILDKPFITVDGAGSSLDPTVGTVILTGSPAITVTANNDTLQDMALTFAGVGTPGANDIGILLDGTTTANLTGINIINVDFSNLQDGIRSQGDIGDGNAATVDVTIRGNSNTDRAIFEDLVDAAIDIGDTDGDAVYLIRDLTLRDGADANTVVSGGDGIRVFSDIGAATIRGVIMSADAGDDGIDIAAQTNSAIQIGGLATADVNTILGTVDGIAIGNVTGGSSVVANNTLVRGTTGDGISVQNISNGAAIGIVGNAEIRGVGADGILVNSITGSTLSIAGNTRILSDAADGLFIINAPTNSNVAIGPAFVTVDGVNTLFGGNGTIQGADNGLDIDGVNGGTFTVALNGTILGTADSGIEFDNTISNGAVISIAGNTQVRGGEEGVEVEQAVNASTINIAGNTSIRGDTAEGIFFGATLTNATIVIGSATVSVAGTDTVFAGNNEIIGAIDGVSAGNISGGSFTVANNPLIRGNTFDGISVGNMTNGALLAVAGNTEIRGGDGSGTAGFDGIAVLSADTSTITIAGNTGIFGDADGIFVENALTNATVTIGPATVTVNGVATAFGGNTQIFGAGNGISLGAVSGGTLLIDRNTLISGLDDGIDFNAAVSNNADVDIVSNVEILGGEDALDIGAISSGTFTVANNTRIEGTAENGIEFEDLINGTAQVDVRDNARIAGGERGFEFRGAIGGTATVIVDRNGRATQGGAAYDGTQEVELATFAVDTITVNTVNFATSVSGGTAEGMLFNDIGENASVTVARNILDGSGGNGITFNSSIASTQTTAVHNNFIQRNGGNGIQFGGDVAGRTEIFQNFIDRNGGDGVRVGRSASLSADSLFVQINFLPGAGFDNGNGGFGYNQLGVGTPDLDGNWWGTPFAAGIVTAINGASLPGLVTLTTGDDDANISPPFANTAFEMFAFQPATIGPPIFDLLFDGFPTDVETLRDEVRGPESQLDRPGGAQFFTNELAEPFQTTVFTDAFSIGELQPAAGDETNGPVNLGGLEPAAGPGSAEAQAEDICVQTYFGDFWNAEAACQ